MTTESEYKYSGNFCVNHNTTLAEPLRDNNKKRLFKRLRDCAEAYLAKGYRLDVAIYDSNDNLVASKRYQF